VKTVWVFSFLGKNISVNLKTDIDKNRITRAIREM
jgi:hypothetical protein